MNPTGLWAINANIQLLTVLILILLVLLYIAFYKTPLGPLQKKLPLDK